MSPELPFFHKATNDINFSVKRSGISPFILYSSAIVTVIVFLLLASRLFELTIVRGAYFESLSDQNRIREIVIEAERGNIYDRNGIILAESSPSDINTKGVDRITSSRTYYDSEPFAHLLGYRQIADKQDMENDLCRNKITLGDKVGKKGVEKAFDCLLRGTNGSKLIEVDASGNFKETLTIIPPEKGENVTLALDSELQKRAFEIIEGKKAVVVAMDPRNGEILALTSNPSFDPQAFENDDAAAIEEYFTDENRPLFNRSTEGAYPPGSVFKMTVLAAALEEEAIDRSTTVEDTGKVELGDRSFGTWGYLEYGFTEGDVDALASLQRSNDIYYYKVGEQVGPEAIKKWSERFGFNDTSGIGVNEVAGSIPSPFWKEDVLEEEWYLGDTYNMSIGQGYVLTTPLQINLAVAPFANGGKYCKPVLGKIGTNEAFQQDCKPMELSEETIAIIREGMKLACTPGGTGWPFFNFRVMEDGKQASPSALLFTDNTEVEDVFDRDLLMASGSAEFQQSSKLLEVGCKTGTAESQEGKDPHAWFTAFAPFENPEILVTVLVENGGQGSDTAAPIAREVLRKYFEK